MTKFTRFFITIFLAVIAFSAKSQSTATTSSPYSKFGLGEYESDILPQNRAMGGIATAINSIGGYNNINPENPASYGAITWTTIDFGIYGDYSKISQSGQASASNNNFRLSHVNFAIPVSKQSAISFGLMPYSQIGYNYIQTLNRGFGTGAPSDTNKTNYIYTGDGGLSKAYFGYGVKLFKHLLIGANASYIFGKLENFETTEIPALYGTLNTRVENSNSVKGFNFDLGAQYQIDFINPDNYKNKHLIFAYSNSLGNSISSTSNYIVSQFTLDGSGNENVAADTVKHIVGASSKIKLPQINHFGVSYQVDASFLVGADYTMGKWSDLSIDGVNAGLQNNQIINVGGQITPNVNSLNNYWARCDYRLGFMYENTFLNSNLVSTTANGMDIKNYSVSFGVGLPIVAESGSFYKINVSAEVGQRGTLQNDLIKENYVNIHLGFTLNDKWFRRYKFE